MAKNTLWQVREYGQNIWYDSISRDLVNTGGLQKLVDEYAVVGVTSNPTVLEKAIGGSADYDDETLNLARTPFELPVSVPEWASPLVSIVSFGAVVTW